MNYYAHPPQANGYLYHVLLTIPENSIPDGVFNPGLYVEGSDYIPHVSCEAYADDTGYYWDVEYSSDAGKTYTILYISKPSNMPHTQDCTIITNGSNYLKVYIGGNLVYTNSTMSLGMSTPFVTFVQDDTSSSSSMHNETFANYYATTDENIKVTNNPSNAATVKILDSSGNVLAISSVTSGTATLNIVTYDFPLAATINVYNSSNSVIASSSASIYGGDVYSVSSSPGSSTAPQSPTDLTATAASSSQIALSWTAPSNNGGSSIIGYKIERSTDSGTTWSTVTSGTGSASTTYSDTGLSSSTTYTYRVSAINAVGTSLPSNTASATTQGTGTGSAGSIVLTGIQSTSGTVSSSPYQFTIANVNAGTGSNNLLVVGVAANNDDVGSITFEGAQLTKAISSFNNNDAEFWYLKNPSGTGNVVVTMKGATAATIGVYALSGVDQTSPIATSTANHNSSPSNPTISITTINPNDWF
ncbi:MAG: fibronectin type III domain-containing protein [Thaumarchaeota archaeon]|nr:fibronectin type III domain-containing protein [Nitrososphaerota archaeon]